MKRQRLDELDILIESAVEDTRDEFDEFDNLDISDVEFSPSYKRRKRKIIRRYKYASVIATAKKIASRAAMFAGVLLTVVFITIMSVSALRNAVINAVLEWYDDYVSIRFETEAPSKNIEAEPSKTEEPWEAVMKVRRPRKIPEGVEEVVLLESQARVLIDYYIDGNRYASYNQNILNEHNSYVDNEDTVIQYTKIHGNDATIFKSCEKQEEYIVWQDGIYIYIIVLYEEGDLIAIAESVE